MRSRASRSRAPARRKEQSRSKSPPRVRHAASVSFQQLLIDWFAVGNQGSLIDWCKGSLSATVGMVGATLAIDKYFVFALVVLCDWSYFVFAIYLLALAVVSFVNFVWCRNAADRAAAEAAAAAAAPHNPGAAPAAGAAAAGGGAAAAAVAAPGTAARAASGAAPVAAPADAISGFFWMVYEGVKIATVTVCLAVIAFFLFTIAEIMEHHESSVLGDVILISGPAIASAYLFGVRASASHLPGELCLRLRWPVLRWA